MSVFVAGMGAVSSPGNSVQDSFSAIVQGRDGIRPLSIFDSRLKVPPFCAEIAEIPEKYSDLYRSLALAMAAVDEAMHSMPDEKTSGSEYWLQQLLPEYLRQKDFMRH